MQVDGGAKKFRQIESFILLICSFVQTAASVFVALSIVAFLTLGAKQRNVE